MSVGSQKLFRFGLSLLTILILIDISGVNAEDKTKTRAHCVSAVVPSNGNEQPSKQDSTQETLDDATTLNADYIETKAQSHFVLKGNVSIKHKGSTLTANSAEYRSDQVKVPGKFRINNNQMTLVGKKAEFNIKNSTGTMGNLQYWLRPRHLRGEAKQLKLDNSGVLHMQSVTYTRCDEGDEAWLLRASELELDRENNRGVAHHARVEIQGVPVFYWPYLSFPLEGRKSGFLAPLIGNSNKIGRHIGLPYYWNIAPDKDATVTPHFYSRRGAQINTEFRFLNPESDGTLYVEYLPNDRKTGEDLSAGTLRHRTKIVAGWQSSVNFRYASDRDYLSDFGTNLDTSSLTHLERRLDLSYRADNWGFIGLLQGFQTLDELDPRPYQRLPQINLFTEEISTWGGLQFTLNSEWVKFDKTTGVIGSRLDLQPAVLWPLRRAAGFLVPKLTLRHTRYRLSRQFADTNSEPRRSLPIASIDSGLFFDRKIQWGDKILTQSLEPRLFYLYVPFREQSDLIVDQDGQSVTFDSGLPTLDYNQLFRENRFTGADRVGDSDQLTFALTSRLIAATGYELLRASLGQIFYFDSRRVSLPGEAIQSDNQSDLLTELRVPWSHQFDSQATLLWDPGRERTSRSALRFRYRPDKDKMLTLSHRYERDTIEEADFSLRWSLHKRWGVTADWRYSLSDDLSLERAIGFDYDSCCWAFNVVAREYLDNEGILERNYNKAIWFQLELKGLMNINTGG
jgi:LPS-assembly protein